MDAAAYRRLLFISNNYNNKCPSKGVQTRRTRLSFKQYTDSCEKVNKSYFGVGSSYYDDVDNNIGTELKFEVSQVSESLTQCVFLGSLFLKPVPHLFGEVLQRCSTAWAANTNMENELKSLLYDEDQNKVINPNRRSSALIRSKRTKANIDGSSIINQGHQDSHESSDIGFVKINEDRHQAISEGEQKNYADLKVYDNQVENSFSDKEDVEDEEVESIEFEIPYHQDIIPHITSEVEMPEVETPELETEEEEDDDTIDQLMYNIMDIKVNTSVFDNSKRFFSNLNLNIQQVQQQQQQTVDNRAVMDQYEFMSDEDEEDNSSTAKELVAPKKAKKKGTLNKNSCIKTRKTIKDSSSSSASASDNSSNKRRPQCKICSQVFQNYAKLKSHQLDHNGDKPYPCLKCGENHTTLDSLIAHLRSHEGKRPYLCKKCHKGFRSKRMLEVHEQSHTVRKVGSTDDQIQKPPQPSRRTFKCETCDKEFKKMCDLDRHRRVHTGEKPSECGICHRRFQQAHNLNKHLIIHTREKPFECDVCNKRFGRNDVLNRHLLTHSVKKPNHCEVCKKSFIRASQLAAHVEKYHPLPSSDKSPA